MGTCGCRIVNSFTTNETRAVVHCYRTLRNCQKPTENGRKLSDLLHFTLQMWTNCWIIYFPTGSELYTLSINGLRWWYGHYKENFFYNRNDLYAEQICYFSVGVVAELLWCPDPATAGTRRGDNGPRFYHVYGHRLFLHNLLVFDDVSHFCH